MSSFEEHEFGELQRRIRAAEAGLRRVKYVLFVVAVLVICLVLPPVAAILAVAVLIGITLICLIRYMFSVILACERLFDGRTDGQSGYEEGTWP